MEGRERHEVVEEEEVEEEEGGVQQSTTIFSVPFIRHVGQLAAAAATTVN